MITEDIQILSERISKFIEAVPHYPVPEEGAPRNLEFQKTMRTGFMDCFKLLLSARPEVFAEVAKHIPIDKEAEVAYWKGFRTVLFDASRWGIQPGWDERVNQL